MSDLSFYGIDLTINNYTEGTDVTSLMKISKFVSSEEMSQYTNVQSSSSGQSMMAAAFPVEMVPKTNEPNLQSYTKYLEQIENRRVTISLKLDGSSMTVTSDGKLCGRNFEWVEKNTSNKNYFAIQEKYNIKEKIKNSSYHVQGELVGPSIQKNPLGLKEIDFYVFNISFENHYLSHPQTVKKCEEWGFKSVPCLYSDVNVKTLPFKTVEDWLDFADKQVYPTNGKMAEGIVVKTSDDLEPRISFKVLSRKYIVK